jgi:tetratricopeptide (TPR) repeat protein
MSNAVLKLDPRDNVLIALQDLRKGERIHFAAQELVLVSDLPAKHKFVAAHYLERAQRIDPSSYDNGYDLALAYVLTGRLSDGRHFIHDLLEQKNTAELRNLLGELEEREGQFVTAEN